VSKNQKQMTFLGHLTELRQRLIRSLIALVITTIISAVFARHIFNFLTKPAPEEIKLIFIEMTEMLGTYFTVSLTGGLVLAMPFLVYQVIMFLSPALTKREKRYVYLVLPWITLMFIGGVAFAYFLLAPPAARFLVGFGSDIAEPTIKIGNYLWTITRLLIAVGLVFEFPFIVTVLARLGIVKPQWLSSKRRYALVGVFILAAVATPPDPVTQLLLAAPLILLYEISILLAKVAYRKRMEADSDYLPD